VIFGLLRGRNNVQQFPIVSQQCRELFLCRCQRSGTSCGIQFSIQDVHEERRVHVENDSETARKILVAKWTVYNKPLTSRQKSGRTKHAKYMVANKPVCRTFFTELHKLSNRGLGDWRAEALGETPATNVQLEGPGRDFLDSIL
jgi:hypothetical protein